MCSRPEVFFVGGLEGMRKGRETGSGGESVGVVERDEGG